MIAPRRPVFRALGTRRLAAPLPLGFSSGLPLVLTAGTLQAWMADVDVDLTTIGIVTLVGLPYTLKFLWAPLMDRFVPPLLGRRRGWLVVTQLALLVGIGAMGTVRPDLSPGLMATFAILVAFASASQDIAADAYRTDVLDAPERGLGATLFVGGYRVGMLVAGSLALVLADAAGWRITYFAMAALMLLGMAGTLFWAPPPARDAPPPPSLAESVVQPLRQLLTRPAALGILALLVLYKLGDAAAGSLTMAFLIKGAGFSKTAIGVIYKWTAFGAILGGMFVGGVVLARWGLFRALLWFGALQMVTNLSFVLLAVVGDQIWALVLAVGLENLAGGAGTAAFVALMMGLCDIRYSATQYALLSALSSLGRVLVGPAAGAIASAAGWIPFFLVTTAAAIPGLVLLVALRRRVEDADADVQEPSRDGDGPARVSAGGS